MMPSYDELYNTGKEFKTAQENLVRVMKITEPSNGKVYIDYDFFKDNITRRVTEFRNWFNAQNNGWNMRIETNVKNENFVELTWNGN